MRPVIVYESHDADDFADALADFFLNQMISDQVANRLGAVGITHRGDAPVKGAKQILLQRDAEARYLRHTFGRSTSAKIVSTASFGHQSPRWLKAGMTIRCSI